MHVFGLAQKQDVDGRVKPGHDEEVGYSALLTSLIFGAACSVMLR